jgi:hypothetical protein
MTDKERILIQIGAMTAFGTTKFNNFSEDSVHWETIHQETKLQKGDIVCGVTNPNHKFGIAFFEERTGYSDFVVREIGSNKTCNYTNEMFLVLRNFPEIYKLCGNEYKTMIKARKAFYHTYTWVFAGIKFEPKKLIITMRKKWTDIKETFELNYDCHLSRITIKSIKDAIDKETKSK